MEKKGEKIPQYKAIKSNYQQNNDALSLVSDLI